MYICVGGDVCAAGLNGVSVEFALVPEPYVIAWFKFIEEVKYAAWPGVAKTVAGNDGVAAFIWTAGKGKTPCAFVEKVIACLLYTSPSPRD